MTLPVLFCMVARTRLAGVSPATLTLAEVAPDGMVRTPLSLNTARPETLSAVAEELSAVSHTPVPFTRCPTTPTTQARGRPTRTPPPPAGAPPTPHPPPTRS